MAWFKKTRKPIASASSEKPSRVPEGLWVKCPSCAQIIYNKDLEKNLSVCPKCAHHFRLGAVERLRSLFDDQQWTEHFAGRDVCCNVVQGLEQAVQDPQFRARGVFRRSVVNAEGDGLPAVNVPIAEPLRDPRTELKYPQLGEANDLLG